MSTRKQILANRRNAQFSTGPKTKEALSQLPHRARKHSLSGTHVVLPYEDPADYDALRDDLYKDYAPANTQESLLVDDIAQQHWKLQRANRLEVAQMTTDYERALETIKKTTPNETAIDPDRALAMAISQDPVQLLLLHRYTVTIERSLQRFIRDLQMLQKDRRHQEHHPAPSKQTANPIIGSVSQNALQPEPEPHNTAHPPTPSPVILEEKWIRRT